MFSPFLKFLAVFLVCAKLIFAEKNLGANDVSEMVNDHVVNNITNLRGGSNFIFDGITITAATGLSQDFANVSADLFSRTLAADLENSITTVAGTGYLGYNGDGIAATAASLYYPTGVAVDGQGNIYIADIWNHRVRKVTVSNGIITTIAGTGTAGYNADGIVATTAKLNGPTDMAFDGSGNVYIAESLNYRIRKVTVSTGIITTVAGTGIIGYNGDGITATSAQLSTPNGIAIDGSGNIYIADSWNHRIRKVTVSTGIITTIAGTGAAGYNGDGIVATTAKLYKPYGVAIDGSGNVYIADTSNNRVRKLMLNTGIITTIATTTQMLAPLDVAIDGSGDIYIADHFYRIRKVTVSTGIITTIAGTGTAGYNGDGITATSALVNNPSGIDIDRLGNVYIGDTENSRIRVVRSTMPTVSPRVGANIENFVTTIAGTGIWEYNGDGIAATSAAVKDPFAVAVDGQGNVYIADTWNHRIRKVAASTGIITTIAGTGTAGYNADGIVATTAKLNGPLGVAIDGSGNVFIADTSNHRIRKVTVSTGIITTVAGTGTMGHNGDGITATSAQLNNPNDIGIDGSGNIYITDTLNHRIRKVTVSTGIITTIAGTGAAGYNGDGIVATTSKVYNPIGIDIDGSGNIYIADTWNQRVRKVTVSTGIITTIAGTGITGYNAVGITATSADLFVPADIAIDGSGYIYISDSYNQCIRKVTVSTGIITTIAGTSKAGYNGDILMATSTPMNTPVGIAVDRLGNVYFADSLNSRIRVVTSTLPTISPSVGTNVIKTVAGTGLIGAAGYNGDGIAATSAQLGLFFGVAADVWGNVYIADTSNHRVRKVTVSTGIITTIAGTGAAGYNADGIVATTAKLNGPTGVAIDGSGNVYIADSDNNRVRKLMLSTGIITTVAGTGTFGYNGDGILATNAQLNYPLGVTVDRSGNIYIVDKNNHRVRKVTVSTGIITTVAGTGAAGYNGDRIVATSAQLSNPNGIAIDGSGNIYIADTENHRIRKVTVSTGIITTVAGTGTMGHNGDGIAATMADLKYPRGVNIDGSGNVYIADTLNHRIRKVTVSTGIITAVAGTGSLGFNGDGIVATNSLLYGPHSVAVDRFGNVYIADTTNCRVRVLVRQV
jgi:sugar lactone lactonase YvrE